MISINIDLFFHTIRLGAQTTESVVVWDFSVHPHIQTGFGAHPALLFSGNWAHFPGDKVARDIEHATTIHCRSELEWRQQQPCDFFLSVTICIVTLGLPSSEQDSPFAKGTAIVLMSLSCNACFLWLSEFPSAISWASHWSNIHHKAWFHWN